MTAPTKKSMQRSPRGFSMVAVYRPKHEVNVGTLWRSAFSYGAAGLATVGRRYERQPSDTPKTPGRIPLTHFADIDDLLAHLPWGTPLIGVELDERATPLSRFCHPASALYLLGSEDAGLPPKVLDRCHHIVQIESLQPWSLNVAVAGSLVLHDRYVKGLR